MGYDHSIRQIAATKPHVTGLKLIPPCGTQLSWPRPDRCIVRFASVSRTLWQNVSGHQTKCVTPQELSPSSNLQLNQGLPTLSHCSNTEYACCTTMSHLLDVHFLAANFEVFAQSFLNIVDNCTAKMTICFTRYEDSDVCTVAMKQKHTTQFSFHCITSLIIEVLYYEKGYQ